MGKTRGLCDKIRSVLSITSVSFGEKKCHSADIGKYVPPSYIVWRGMEGGLHVHHGILAGTGKGIISRDEGTDMPTAVEIIKS